MIRCLPVILPAVLTATLQAPALAEPSLRIGDPAPPLQLDDWLSQGEAPQAWVEAEQIEDWTGGVTVVEFWATWCGPCIAGFEDLSAFQEEFAERGVRVLAVSNEPAETCERFMQQPTADGRTQTDRMRFAVASDADQSAWKGYLTASGREIIPRAFVIGKTGRIEWIGHPKVDDMPNVIRAVLDETWDRDAYRAAFERNESSDDAFDAALESGDWDAAESRIGREWVRATRLAFTILLSPQGEDAAMIERATRLTDLAMELSGGEQGFVYHVAALAKARVGDYARAVELQRRAIEFDDGQGGAWYTQALEQYEQALAEE